MPFALGAALPARADAPATSATARPTPTVAPVREIAHAKAAVGVGELQTNAEVTRTIAPQTLGQGNALRVGDALTNLAGVDRGSDSNSAGDDEYLDIRGLEPSESQVLLDGHPIGPIGISASGPDADGVIEGFNFQDSPNLSLDGVDVTFGAGASGLYGGNTVGGTIDLHTLNPSYERQFTLDEGMGNEGRTLTSLKASGTSGRLGYALVDGVEGTYGTFPGGDITQTGLRGTDFTSSTLAQLTYPVSGDYLLRNALGKLTYRLSPATNASFTAYDATSWSDKTGNGDNDYNSPSYMLANAPVGQNPNCPSNLVGVQTDSGLQCILAAQYAQGASGPAGGGPDAWQAFRNQDYHVRLASSSGDNSLLFDAFTDNYAFTYHRSAWSINGPIGVDDPLDVFFDRWSTQGLLTSDDIATARNDFGFGYYLQRQVLSGNQTTPDGSAFQNDAPASRIDNAFFIRDTYTANERLSFVLNAWYNRASVDPQAHLNPRLSAIYKASSSDVLRLTSGRSVSEPGLELNQVTLTPLGALNPDCGAIEEAQSPARAPAQVNVGSGPASNVSPEKATDIELSYGHRFTGDSAFDVTLYDTNLIDRIVSANLPAGNLISTSAMDGVYSRIQQFCGLSPSPTSLQYTLSLPFNAATAQAHGVEFSGRARATQHLYFDYSYDIQSLVINGVPNAVLTTDPTLVNGIQAFQVPLHKASLGIDVSTASGFEGRLDGHFVSVNNPQQLPGYAYADASLTQHVSRRLTLDVGISNVFDSHANVYNDIGFGVPYSVSPANAALGLGSPFSQPFNTLYGLPPPSVMFNAELRV